MNELMKVLENSTVKEEFTKSQLSFNKFKNESK